MRVCVEKTGRKPEDKAKSGPGDTQNKQLLPHAPMALRREQRHASRRAPADDHQSTDVTQTRFRAFATHESNTPTAEAPEDKAKSGPGDTQNKQLLPHAPMALRREQRHASRLRRPTIINQPTSPRRPSARSLYLDNRANCPRHTSSYGNSKKRRSSRDLQHNR